MVMIYSGSQLTVHIARLENRLETDWADAFLMFEYLIPLDLTDTILGEEAFIPDFVRHAAAPPTHDGTPDTETLMTMGP